MTQNIKITTHGIISQQEIDAYIQRATEKFKGRRVKEIVISEDEEDSRFVNIRYTLEQMPFERIRRITGYLVGDVKRWNGAKLAELHDRVKHG